MSEDETETFATVRGTTEKLTEMIRLASGGYHDDVFVRVVGDQDTVYTIAQTGGNHVMSYCTFEGFKEVSGDAEAVIPTGNDKDTKGYLDYMDFAGGSGTIEMEFQGIEGDGDHPRLADYWHASGALNATIRLPGSEDDLAHVPWRLPNRWTDRDRFVSAAALDETGEIDVGEDEIEEHIPPTEIVTTADTVRSSIIKPADFMDGVRYYPVSVVDEQFWIDVEGDDGDDRIDGAVNAESVVGPDVSRAFDEGFKELFSELEGSVRLTTAPSSDAPLVVVQRGSKNQTIRHVLAAFAED